MSAEAHQVYAGPSRIRPLAKILIAPADPRLARAVARRLAAQMHVGDEAVVPIEDLNKEATGLELFFLNYQFICRIQLDDAALHQHWVALAFKIAELLTERTGYSLVVGKMGTSVEPRASDPGTSEPACEETAA